MGHLGVGTESIRQGNWKDIPLFFSVLKRLDLWSGESPAPPMSAPANSGVCLSSLVPFTQTLLKGSARVPQPRPHGAASGSPPPPLPKQERGQRGETFPQTIRWDLLSFLQPTHLSEEWQGQTTDSSTPQHHQGQPRLAWDLLCLVEREN